VQQVKHIATDLVRQQSSELSAPRVQAAEHSTPSRDDLDELWRRMARMYGHKWVSSYGDRDDGTWRAGLRGLAREQIVRGLRRCADSGDPWPPSLPEFRALCTKTEAAEAREFLALPEPDGVREARRQRAREWFAQMRRDGIIRPRAATE
jgi:hypothetical protein